MSDDYDYNLAPENLCPEEAAQSIPCEPDYEKEYDEEYEIQKAERRYERYIGRS